MPLIVANMNGGVLFENGQELVNRLLIANSKWLKYEGTNCTELKTKLEVLRDHLKGKLEDKANPPRGVNKTCVQIGLQEINKMIKYTKQEPDGKFLPDYLENELVINLEEALKMKREQVGEKVGKRERRRQRFRDLDSA
jgi:hypothetical protein